MRGRGREKGNSHRWFTLNNREIKLLLNASSLILLFPSHYSPHPVWDNLFIHLSQWKPNRPSVHTRSGLTIIQHATGVNFWTNYTLFGFVCEAERSVHARLKGGKVIFHFLLIWHILILYFNPPITLQEIGFKYFRDEIGLFSRVQKTSPAPHCKTAYHCWYGAQLCSLFRFSAGEPCQP